MRYGLILAGATLTLGAAVTAQAQQPSKSEIDAMLSDTEVACKAQFDEMVSAGQAEGASIDQMRLMIARLQYEINEAPADQLGPRDAANNHHMPPVMLSLINCMIARQQALRGGAKPQTKANLPATTPLGLSAMTPQQAKPIKENKVYFVGGTYRFAADRCNASRTICVTGGVNLIMTAEDAQGYRFAAILSGMDSGRFSFNNDPFDAGVRYEARIQSTNNAFFDCNFIRGKDGSIPAEESARDLHNPAMIMAIECTLSAEGHKELERLTKNSRD